MRLCLVRHGIAVDREAHRSPDAERPLTEEGHARMERAASGLTRLVAADAIFTSPYKRALQTAEILADAFGIAQVHRTHALVTGDDDGLFALMANAGGVVIVVGHEPHISGTLAYSLTGKWDGMRAEFKKGGAALVSFGGPPKGGAGTLEWLLQPGTLRSLGVS